MPLSNDLLFLADCDKSCLTCSGPEPSHCLSCGTNRHKDASGHCVWYTECPLQSYMQQNGECQQCHKLCHRCSGPGKDHCLSCSEPRFLLSELLKYHESNVYAFISFNFLLIKCLDFVSVYTRQHLFGTVSFGLLYRG